MRKKIMVILGCVLLCLSACGGEGQQYSKEELTVRFWRNAYGDATKESLTEVVKENLDYYPDSIYWDEVLSYREETWDETEEDARIYPLFYTDMVVYTEEDFADASDVVIMIARNEIFARHGYIFEDSELNSYFGGCEWYTPMYTKDNFNTELLNENEWANLDVLNALEE